MYQIGNPDFKPEFSLQGDLGLFYNSKPVIASVEAFYNDISNYIFNQKVLNQHGQDSVIVKGNQTFKFRQSDAVLYGGEANLDIHFFKWLHFENSLSVVYGVNKGGNGIKSTIAQNIFHLSLHYILILNLVLNSIKGSKE